MDRPAPTLASESVWKHNQGRDPRRLALKLERMSASPFAFFRGACHRFYETLPEEGLTRDAPAAWIAGDLHLENFGSYKGDNRLAYFDLNDFDESCLAPLTWDVARFEASLFLGMAPLGVGPADAEALAARFGRTYAETLREGHARWIERRTARGAVRRLLRAVAHRDADALLDERAPRRRGRRRLLVGGPPEKVKALPADADRRARVKEAIESLDRDAGGTNGWTVLDVQDRVAGTGSLGLERYVVLAQGAGDDSTWLLDVKAVPSSAPARHSPCRQPAWDDEAARATTLQRTLQAVPPARLTTVHVGGVAHVVRELLPSEDRVDLARATRDRDRIGDLVEDMARVVAWAHLRGAGRRGAAGPDALAAFAEDASWQAPLVLLAQRLAQATHADHAQFLAARRTPGAPRRVAMLG
jgi:uncharacterized protein (DUF2252 family)